VPVSDGHVLGKAVAGAEAASGAGAAIIRRLGGCKLFLFFGPATADEPCPVLTSSWEKLVHERGAGSGEQGFHLLFFRNFDDHGEEDLLPWIINVWTFIKYWR
jgi:hypothetical protein